jgi:hypothetical protein
MSDAAVFARPAALLGVLVSSNDAPDMVELDTKDQLSAARCGSSQTNCLRSCAVV